MNDKTFLSHKKVSIISEFPLFANLPLKAKELIARSSILAEYRKDEIVYREGDPPDAFYCVMTGRVRIYVKRGSRPEDLEYLKRGKYFGIISLLTGEAHSVTAEVVNDSIILKIPKDAFEKILKRVPALAIDLSQTLSRRLKAKGGRRKKIFESAIISVYGTSDRERSLRYALNLAASLKVETNKRIILLNIAAPGENLSAGLGVKISSKPIHLRSPFISGARLKSAISRQPFGVDVINVAHLPKAKAHIIALLSYLTCDYHYVVTNLPDYMDKVTFEALRQSDAIHIITSSGEAALRSAGNLITELEKSSAGIRKKIKVITAGDGDKSLPMDFDKKTAILKHGIFATLPDIKDPRRRSISAKAPTVITHPESDYAKALRRVSREVGECMMGLALGCGAALGLAQIGIIRVFEKERIPIDVVCGTSIGSLIGALWAAGRSASDMEKIIAAFKKKTDALRFVDLTLPTKGLIKGREVSKFLTAQFGGMTFYDLKRTLRIVTCNIETREEVVLDRGSVADAVMASVAIPGIFEPVMINGRPLVDGGIINPLPTNVLMRMGVTKIIAVNTLPSPEDIQMSRKKVTNIFDILVNGIQASEYLLAETNCQNADIAMHPMLPKVDWYEIYEGLRAIKRGEEEALKFLPRIKELIKE